MRRVVALLRYAATRRRSADDRVHDEAAGSDFVVETHLRGVGGGLARSGVSLPLEELGDSDPAAFLLGHAVRDVGRPVVGVGVQREIPTVRQRRGRDVCHHGGTARRALDVRELGQRVELSGRRHVVGGVVDRRVAVEQTHLRGVGRVVGHDAVGLQVASVRRVGHGDARVGEAGSGRSRDHADEGQRGRECGQPLRSGTEHEIPLHGAPRFSPRGL